MPPDDGEVHLCPRKFDPIEDGVNHPTISQDWTNREVNDRNRLLALQGRKALDSSRRIIFFERIGMCVYLS